MNEYAESTIDQINADIKARLSGDAHNYWAQQPHREINELCCEVQSGRLTIDQAAKLVEEYAV